MAIFTVTNLEDSGAGSLRQAIEDANSQPGKDEIIFEDSLSGGRIDFIINEFEDRLEITDSVSIQGLGAEQLAIGSNEIIFRIDDGTENVIEVEIDNISLVENGTRDLGRFGYYGAAIINRENLTVTNSVIRDGDFPSDGIIVNGYDNLAELTLIDSTISGYRNGINSTGENLDIIRSSIFDNSYRGIFSRADGVRTPFSSVNYSVGTIEIRQSTISGNGNGNDSISSYPYGGGILINGSSITTATISNSTISNNTGSGVNYPASSSNTPSSEFVITSSIVAGNRAKGNSDTVENQDLAGDGVFTSGGNNLIGVGGDTSFVDGVNGDIVGTAENPIDPLLGNLQDNGGATPTQALLSDSPAIDAGSNPLGLETDQRGEGFERVVNGSADIGAFELQNIDTLVGISATTPVAAEGGNNGVFTISRGEQTAGELVVNLLIEPNSTASEEDYNFVGNNLDIVNNRVTLTIPDGASSTNLIIESIDDTFAEDDETIVLKVAATSEYGVNGNNSRATVTIAQNDINTDTVVTNTNDSGTGSLREAIANVNILEGTQTITFASSLQGETITLTSGELAITDSVNIEGLEDRGITISGSNNSGIFNINDGNDNNQIDVNISSVVVTEGKIDLEDVPIYSNPFGGGIVSSENLTITNSTITGNAGDGIGIEDGSLTVNNSSIENNSYTGIKSLSGNLKVINSNITGSRTGISSYGNSSDYYSSEDVTSTLLLEQSTISGNNYGIRNSGSMTINDSTITGNQGTGIENAVNSDLEINKTNISQNSANFDGGGIDNNGSVVISDSTISQNSANFDGGGINNTNSLEIVNSVVSNNTAYGRYGGGIQNQGVVTITNSTISGNSADVGGAISNNIYNRYYYEENRASLTIFNSTITGNSASQGSGIYNGIYVDSYGNYNGETYTSEAIITSTIIAGNEGGLGGAEALRGRDVAGGSEFTSNGNNLIGNGDGASGFSDGVNGDIVGTSDNPIDPLLGTLQDNGGSTPTQALLTGSPAIDAGSNPLDLETDQRGEGFARVRGSQTDIGAFEADADTNPPNGNEGELISGTNKRDSLEGGAGNDTIDGSLARDTINGAGGDDSLFGGRGKDLIFGDAGNDEIAGNQGGDTLEGGSGSDTLFGDEGRDVLVGGAGFDILVGGGSSDSFVIASGQDTDGIIDFEPRRDKLLLSEGLSFGGLTLNQNNEDVDIVLSETDELLAVLIDTNVNNLGKSNFVAG